MFYWESNSRKGLEGPGGVDMGGTLNQNERVFRGPNKPDPREGDDKGGFPGPRAVISLNFPSSISSRTGPGR